jgi:hypothetical protein
MSMRREFAILPPELPLVLLLPVVAMIAGVVGLSFAAREEPRLWLLGVPVALAGALIVCSIKRRRVALDGDVLIIAAGINTLRVRIADLDIASARIVDLTDIPALRLRRKTIGTSMPGYHTGRFRLRDRSRAFVLLTDKCKVLALPERSGRMLLLSLERPQALLDALKTVAQSRTRR